MIDKYIKTNREQRISPKTKAYGWCSSCDAEIVAQGVKCSHCGKSSGKRRLKKDT